MKKFIFSIGTIILCHLSNAQLLTWSPLFPNENSTLVVTVDCSKGNRGLFNAADPNNIYVHTGVTTNLSGNGGREWKYVNGSIGGAWGSATPGLKAVSLGNNKYQYTITNIRAFYGVPAGETIQKVSILFRDVNADGAAVKKQANTDGSDMYIPVYAAASNSIVFTDPALVPVFNTTNEVPNPSLGQAVSFTAQASSTAGTLRLYQNGSLIAGPLSNTAIISASATITTAGTQTFIAEMITAGNSYYDTLQFYVAPANTLLRLPPGVIEGINYWPGCDSVTLVLYAPSKQTAVVVGDFSPGAWVSKPENQMNKTPDGNYYWITLHGLTPQAEYSFQYLVDNTIYVADPYAEKVLDPWNDQYIPAATYPNLKPYPTDPNVSASNGYVSVFKTCETPYEWKVNNFCKPDKRNLVTYELLVRDFGAAKNYQMLIDTINYFKRLGVNSIELMPVNEFSGNESWGYNPTFYCALDKAYGTKNKFKEFIDLCHANNIAVILDVVYNQLDALNAPQGKLYWDAANNRPAANNPWLNTSAPHPYSVFDDLNHTSAATQYLVKRAMEYWIKEYRIDGYRIDLAKGFTQKVTTEATVENFDGTRYANLSRYYDYIVPKYPSTYMILEFLGQQRMEEQFYANKGFMLWSKSTDQYNQATMGYASGSDFSKIMYNSSATQFVPPYTAAPYAVAHGYMESHDEERLMYKNLQFGNSSGAYNVKNLATALDRQAAAAAVFFTAPGPKLLWQFGEMGYDVSIDFGGSRTANKPPKWEYLADPNRKKLVDVYAKLINLHTGNPAMFTDTSFKYDFNDNGGLVKRCQIMDRALNGMKVNVIANLDVVPQTRPLLDFQTTGEWYNYVSNGTGTGLNGPTNSKFTLVAANQTITLQPGEYHVYLNQPANVYLFNGNGNWTNVANWSYGKIPPNPLPAGSEILVNPEAGGDCILDISQSIAPGAKFTVMSCKKFLIPLNLLIQ